MDFALQYATEEMKGDRQIVMQAVSEDGSALQYAAAELRDDADMIEAALANSSWPVIAVKVTLLSGRSCHRIFNTAIDTKEGVLHECAELPAP